MVKTHRARMFHRCLRVCCADMRFRCRSLYNDLQRVPYVAAPFDESTGSSNFMRRQYDAKAESGNGHCNDKLLRLCAKFIHRTWGQTLRDDAGFPNQSSTCADMLIACTSRFCLDFSFFCGGNENWHSVGSLMRKLDIPASRSRFLYGAREPVLGKMMCTYMLRNNVGGVAVHLVQHLLLSAFIGDITVATQEQSNGIGEVNQVVNQLDQMTQQNAALVEESAAAAESLKDQASRLTQVVQIFRLSRPDP